jgi:pimeloyl-ACP methyl ester carboxylesterase
MGTERSTARQHAGDRHAVLFPSGGVDCDGWHYPGSNGGCVVMAGGFGMTKEPATDLFARRFNAAGFAVLAFDYRGFGGSGGSPRKVARIPNQLADWDAALRFAAGLPGVDPERLAVWAFSVSGGYVFDVAARHPELAAAIAQTPNCDGRAAARNASRHQSKAAMLRLTGLALRDRIGAGFGKAPLLVPLTGRPGTVATLTTPDALDGDEVFADYPDWEREVAARSVLPLAFYRPGKRASSITVPLQVIVCDNDQSALAAPAVRAAAQAPRAELVRLPGGHYEPFRAGFEQVVAAELDFLRRALLGL